MKFYYRLTNGKDLDQILNLEKKKENKKEFFFLEIQILPEME